MPKRLRSSLGPPVGRWLRGLIPGTPVAEAWARPIGYLCVWHSLMESRVNQLVSVVLELGFEDSRDICRNVPLGSRIPLVKESGLRKFTGNKQAAFLKVVERMDSANSRRNDIIHHEWSQWTSSVPYNQALFMTLRSYASSGRVTKTRVKRHGSLRHTPMTYTYDDIVGAANDCLSAWTAAGKFLHRYYGWTYETEISVGRTP